MNTVLTLACVVAAAVLLGCGPAQPSSEEDPLAEQAEVTPLPARPNIVIFMADDMGWGDAGCYGQRRLLTPHIDAMAAEGLRFTDAYTGSPVCAPARSSLMEGRHGGHISVRNNQASTASGQRVPVSLPDSVVTMADMLQQAGYATGMFGKWGLGLSGTSGEPSKHGWDEFYGFLNQRTAHHYYVDSLWHNQDRVPVALDADQGIGYSSADWYVDRAAEWIAERAKSEQPFFAYLPTQLPHLYMPYKPLPAYADKPWPEGDKRWATMITMLDAHVGKINGLLDSLGLAENTLVIFLSDNGGGNGQRKYYHNKDFFQSNGPFRGMKRDLYEGGIRVPMVVQWKGAVSAGHTVHEPVAYYDLMATLADLAQTEPPRNDGVSLAPLLANPADSLQRDYLYWEFPYMDMANSKFAVRMGPWKGVKEYENQPMQLYNLEQDSAELYNWALEYPEVVQRMEAIIAAEHWPSPHWPLRSELPTP